MARQTKSSSRAKPCRKGRTAAPPRTPIDIPVEPASLVEMLERLWPSRKTAAIQRVFAALKKTVRESAAGREAPPSIEAAPPAMPAGTRRSFNLLDLLRRTLGAHDLLFLRRRVTYHIAAASDLPLAHADADRVQVATANLLEYMVTRAPRGGRIAIQLQEIPLRSASGIEITCSGIDDSLGTIDKTSLVHRMYEADTEEGMVLISAREIIAAQGGQMWVDLPRPRQPLYHLVLPTTETAADTTAQPLQMYKYDISIANYANVRKRFGIKKSLSLVGQIEMYVRALVRHPIDIVTAVREKGIVTTIYQSPRGAAQTVAGRISQRLGSEEFRIGKRPVDLLFRYHLSTLPPAAASAERIRKGA